MIEEFYRPSQIPTLPSQNSAEQEACRADPGPVEISIDRSQKGGAEFYRCEISSRILKARPENPGSDPNGKNAITIHGTCDVISLVAKRKVEHEGQGSDPSQDVPARCELIRVLSQDSHCNSVVDLPRCRGEKHRRLAPPPELRALSEGRVGPFKPSADQRPMG